MRNLTGKTSRKVWKGTVAANPRKKKQTSKQRNKQKPKTNKQQTKNKKQKNRSRGVVLEDVSRSI